MWPPEIGAIDRSCDRHDLCGLISEEVVTVANRPNHLAADRS